MRFPKTALLAASVLVSSALLADTIFYDTSQFGQSIPFINAGDTAVLNAAFSGSINRITGEGDFVKNGAGVLQYKGFQLDAGFYNTPLGSLINTRYGYIVKANPTRVVPIAVGNDTAGTPLTLDDFSALSGHLTVNQGELQVAGYLNLWKEWIVRGADTNPPNLTPVPDPVMEGVSGVRLNDTARLSFTNTPKNVIPGAHAVFKSTTNHDVSFHDGTDPDYLTKGKRYNVVRNLTVGGVANGAQTVLDTGLDSTYRIIVHIEDDNATARDPGVGSVGILAGRGDIIKTGSDEFIIRGASERGFGRVVIAAGQVRLADTGGVAIATATSVNLVGSDGHRGGSLDSDMQSTSNANGFWRPGLIPNSGKGNAASSLVLNNSQTIRNLQADFAFNVAPDPSTKTVENAILQSWKVSARDEAFTAGTGMGTFIDIGANTLTINQDRDGIYRGSVIGTGTIVANIAKDHRFALVLENAMEANLVIQGAGHFVANANGLGSRTVTVDGNLDIYQDNATTLNASLVGGGSVTLTASLILNNSLTGLDEANNMELNANGNRGTLSIAKRQTGFTGAFRVLNGQTLELSSVADNALDAAAFVSLEGTDPTVFATEGNATTGGRIATLNIADGVQTLNNLQANAFSMIRLGRGSLTVKGSSALNGSITGVGNLLFDGTNALNGANATYTGATVVKSGTLTANGNLANSSGLILAAGTRFNGGSADQTFGALFGGAGSVIDMGARTLTIGATGERETLLQQQLGGQNLLSTNLLATTFQSTVGGSTVSVNDMDTGVAGAAPVSYADDRFDDTISGIAAATRRYLYNVAYDGAALDAAAIEAEAAAAANPGDTVKAAAALAARAKADTAFNTAASLAFAGNITGSGALRKVGGDRLILSGVNTYTGATLVEGGTLQVNGDSIASTSGVNVSLGATFAVNVDSGTLTFDRAIAGAGNFEKVGAGELTLAPGAVTYSGSTIVRAGALRVQIPSAMGTVEIFDGATFIATAGSTTPFASVVKGATGSTFIKEGSDTLDLLNTGDFRGDYVVTADSAGLNTLRIHSTPAAKMTIGAGGTLAIALTGSVSGSSLSVFGDGTLRIEGGSYFFNPGNNTTFTGTLAGLNTTITAGANDIFPLASMSLTGSTLDIGGTSQTFKSLTGDAASTVAMSGGTLTFNPTSGTATYAGKFSGAGALIKDGAGKLSFTSTDNSSTWLGTITVNAGTLEATEQALGSDSTTVLVNLDGTFAARNDNTAVATTYLQSISGAGKLAKTGLGEVQLATVGLTGGVLVHEGRLTITAATDASVFRSVSVDAGATFQVNLPAGGLIHDSASPAGDFITGAGNLAVSGPETLTLLGTQSYTGLTELLNGATLDVTGVTVLNGLKGDAGTFVLLPGALTLNQTSDGAFAGEFVNGGALNITGSGIFSYTGHSGDLGATGVGAVTVSGGNLQVGVVNTATVALTDGTLIIDTGATGGAYSGTVSGTGSILKTGAADFDFATAGNLTGFTGSVGVIGGRLIVTPSTLAAIGATVTSLRTEGAGVLALNAASGTTENLTLAVTGTGALAKTGDGLLKINSATLLGSTGVFTVEQGTLGGTFTTSGDLVVASGGTLAPGNSPGTVTVNGNFTNNGTLAIELNATTSDKVVVNGTATVGGTLALSKDNTAGATDPLRGKAYTIVTATGGVTLNSPAITLSQELKDRNFLRTAFFQADANTLDLFLVQSLNSTPGYTPHDGIGALLALADDGTRLPAPIQALLDFAPASSLRALVNNLTPLGYASEYAMAQDGENRRQALLHDRFEQRRYDRGSSLTAEDAPWEAFVVGGAAFADNKQAVDTPTFDYRTFGGLVGLDRKLNDGLVVGAALGYDKGTATIHDGGGKVEMNRGAGTLFVSGQLTNRWYFDLGATAGVGLYESKRDTAVGRVKGDNMGYSGGLNAESGTLIVLTESLHLTPYVGASYTHHEYDGFTEKGAISALNLDGWSQDSLRTKIGTGLGWFVPVEWCKLKLGFDLAYSHELLDTDSEIDARFVNGTGDKFGTTAAALPQDAISMTPSLGFEFNESTSATISYAYELGFDGRSYQSVNFAVRKRF